jgi:hypothetical protein
MDHGSWIMNQRCRSPPPSSVTKHTTLHCTAVGPAPKLKAPGPFRKWEICDCTLLQYLVCTAHDGIGAVRYGFAAVVGKAAAPAPLARSAVAHSIPGSLDCLFCPVLHPDSFAGRKNNTVHNLLGRPPIREAIGIEWLPSLQAFPHGALLGQGV